MFRIVICDNEMDGLNYYRVMIEEYLHKKLKQYEIRLYGTPDEVILTDVEQVDVFILDVELGGQKNGIELAEKIRKRSQKAYIIFYSNSSVRAYDAFQVNAFRYFLKPVPKESLLGALEVILQKRREIISKLIILQRGHKFIRIPYSEILYFETQERKLHAVTVKKDYMLDNKINELEKQAEEFHFFRIHKSYLINLAFVKEYDQKSVTMMNGDVLFISRLRVKEFKDSYYNYIEGNTPLRDESSCS